MTISRLNLTINPFPALRQVIAATLLSRRADIRLLFLTAHNWTTVLYDIGVLYSFLQMLL